MDIKPFATCTDDELTQYLKMHYAGKIDLTEHWNVGDTRVMHLSAMASGTGASESHVEQNMTMVIIGMNHDTLAEPINGNDKAVLTLQCKECLGNNGTTEEGYFWGTYIYTYDSDNYSNSPRRTWLNETFINSLPSAIKPLVKTVIKKNLANHTNNTAGPNTEDKAFLTSYSEMFGNTSYSYYKGNVELEGEQYSYYSSNERRKKFWNNNGTASSTACYYWLRSPSSDGSTFWLSIDHNGLVYDIDSGTCGLAPAFCLAAEPDPPVIHHKLAKNGKIIQGIAKNGKKLLGIAHAGEVIWKYEKPMPKIVTFKDGTDEEIAAMLDAHYKGYIDVADYWKVGDTRLVHINATNSGTKSHVAQNMTIVIMGFDHDDLTTSINGKTKAAVSVGFKELMGNNGSTENEYYWGSEHYPVDDNENYSASSLRTWLNGELLNVLPTTFSSIIKEVNKKNLAYHSKVDDAPLITNDKIWLLSYPEIFGTASYSYYLNNGTSGSYEGTQYEYMKNSSNRIKYANNNGVVSSSANQYWLRSPSLNFYTGNGYYWCLVRSDGTAGVSRGNLTNGLAPGFCL